VLTYGIVYDSSLIPNFSADIDVWRYKLNDVITLVDVNYAATQCLASGSDQFCGLIHRQPSTARSSTSTNPLRISAS